MLLFKFPLKKQVMHLDQEREESLKTHFLWALVLSLFNKSRKKFLRQLTEEDLLHCLIYGKPECSCVYLQMHHILKKEVTKMFAFLIKIWLQHQACFLIATDCIPPIVICSF